MLLRIPIKHCKNCGTAVVYRVPDDGDTKERAVCPACNTIHYENPLNVVGTIPVLGDKVLLCSATSSRAGAGGRCRAGFMELEETTAQGAARETDEEAGANFEIEGLFAVMSVPRVGQVHLFYRRAPARRPLRSGPRDHRGEALRRGGDPWDEIAFRTVREALQHYFEDRRRGSFDRVHTIDIV